MCRKWPLHIEEEITLKEKIEKIVSFNGAVLETKTAYYSLAFGELNKVLK